MDSHRIRTHVGRGNPTGSVSMVVSIKRFGNFKILAACHITASKMLALTTVLLLIKVSFCTQSPNPKILETSDFEMSIDLSKSDTSTSGPLFLEIQSSAPNRRNEIVAAQFPLRTSEEYGKNIRTLSWNTLLDAGNYRKTIMSQPKSNIKSRGKKKGSAIPLGDPICIDYCQIQMRKNFYSSGDEILLNLSLSKPVHTHIHGKLLLKLHHIKPLGHALNPKDDEMLTATHVDIESTGLFEKTDVGIELSFAIDSAVYEKYTKENFVIAVYAQRRDPKIAEYDISDFLNIKERTKLSNWVLLGKSPIFTLFYLPMMVEPLTMRNITEMSKLMKPSTTLNINLKPTIIPTNRSYLYQSDDIVEIKIKNMPKKSHVEGMRIQNPSMNRCVIVKDVINAEQKEESIGNSDGCQEDIFQFSIDNLFADGKYGCNVDVVDQRGKKLTLRSEKPFINVACGKVERPMCGELIPVNEKFDVVFRIPKNGLLGREGALVRFTSYSVSLIINDIIQDPINSISSFEVCTSGLVSSEFARIYDDEKNLLRIPIVFAGIPKDLQYRFHFSVLVEGIRIVEDETTLHCSTSDRISIGLSEKFAICSDRNACCDNFSCVQSVNITPSMEITPRDFGRAGGKMTSWDLYPALNFTLELKAETMQNASLHVLMCPNIKSGLSNAPSEQITINRNNLGKRIAQYDSSHNTSNKKKRLEALGPKKRAVLSLQKPFEQKDQEEDNLPLVNDQDGNPIRVQKCEPNNVNSSIRIAFGGRRDGGRKKDFPTVQPSMWSYTLNSTFYNFRSPWNPKPNKILEQPQEKDDQ